MEVSKFNEKLNKIDGKIYTIEEEIKPIDGIYEGELIHDNVDLKTLNVYTGSKLTGDKINSYTTSTPSLTPWKTIIKIFRNISPLYISYETIGDTVEAEDINNLQNSVVDIQENLNKEMQRSITRENSIEKNINDYKISNSNEIQSLKSKDIDLDNKIFSKVDKVSGKSLSTNDYDNIEKSKLADVNSQKHNHSNKSIIDKITQDIFNCWNSAYTHITDTIKHITSTERNLWNTVTNKAEKEHQHNKSDITSFPTKVSEFENDKGFMTKSDIDTSQNHIHTNISTLNKITDEKILKWDNASKYLSGPVTWNDLKGV